MSSSLKRPSHSRFNRVQSMKRCMVVVALWSGILGCAGPGTGPSSTVGPLTYKMTGIVAESVPPGTFAFAAFPRTKVAPDPANPPVDLVKPLLSPNVLQTEQAAKLDIRKQVSVSKTYDYSVVFSPPALPAGLTAIASLSGAVDPVFNLQTVGWVWAWRYWPFVGNPWVSAAAQGSTLAIYVRNPDEAWVFYIDGAAPQLPVVCRLDTGFPVQNLTLGQFVIIKDLGTTCSLVGGPKLVDPAGDADQIQASVLRAEMEKVARAAGWTP